MGDRDLGNAPDLRNAHNARDMHGESNSHNAPDLHNDLALRILGECRTLLMMQFRFFDAALWKMPFTPAQFEGALATDGMRFFYNAENVIQRFRLSPTEMARDYLHLVLHCVFRQPFATRREYPMLWSYACDICAEAIALELCEGRLAGANDVACAQVLKRLSAQVQALTPAQVYGLMQQLRKLHDAGKLTYEQQQLHKLLRESESLFIRDAHDYWDLSALSSPEESDEQDNQEEGDQPPQDSSDEGAGATAEDGTNDTDEAGGNVDTRNGEGGQGKSGGEGQGQSNSDNASSEGSTQEAPDDAAEGEGAPENGSAPEAPDADASSAPQENQPQQQRSQSANEQAPHNAQQQSSGQQQQGQQQTGAANSEPSSEVPQAPVSDLDAEQAQRDWEDIGKQIQADLETLSQQRGSGAGQLMANLELANRDQVDYAAFLRQFAHMGEDLRLSSDEFDYVYYTYGLATYGNMPLVEPLEYSEAKRVREFVIALDTSGSCSGALIQRFVERTFSLLKTTEEFGTQVNVHIIQCDAEIQDDAVITSVDDFTRYLDSFGVKGFGGTDFRPVFAYIDKLMQEGEFSDLRGLIYFTDGAGVYPETPPDYEVAFVFVDEAGAKRKVPPWAMRVVMSEQQVLELP